MACKRKASNNAKDDNQPKPKRSRAKKRGDDTNSEVGDESDQVPSTQAPQQAPPPATRRKIRGSQKNDVVDDADSQVQESHQQISQPLTGRRLRSGKKMVFVDVPQRKGARASLNTVARPEVHPPESVSCPKPRPIMHPRPFKSPDPWGGWNKAHNKASAQRHEKRVAEYLQRLEEEESATATSTVGDSAASSAASDNASLTVSANISRPPTCNTGASSPLGSHEDNMEEDARSNGSDLRKSYATTLIRIGCNPASPSFSDNIREAQVFNENLKDDNFDVDDVIRSSGPPPDGLPEHPAPGSPPSEDPPNQGSEPDGDEPERPDRDSDSSLPSSPTPPRSFQYKFHKCGSVYWGESIRTGDQTAVDRFTSYRHFGEGPWKPVPKGFVVPRLDNAEEHERDATRLEYQLVALQAADVADRRLSRERARRAAIEEGEREKAEFAADEKSKSMGRKTSPTKPKLVKIPREEGYQTPSESDGSGSDYSATEKEKSKKRPPPSSSSSSSEDDAASDTPKLPPRPKKQVRLQQVTPTLRNGHDGRRPPAMLNGHPPSTTPTGRRMSATPTGRSQSVTPKTGRPPSEQLEYARAIRSRFDAEIKKAAQLFQAKEATILKQVGFGGQSTQQEHNLYNLFTSARKRDQIEELRTGNWQQEARDDYHAATDHMTDEQKDDYQQHLFNVLGSAMKKELKTVSPASRMTKVEKHIMHFLTSTSRTHPDLHLFVLKVYAGDDPAAKRLNGVLTGSSQGHQTLQDLQIDITAVINFLYDHIRHNNHGDALKALMNGGAFLSNAGARTETSRDTTTPAPDDDGRKSPFIPLLEAQKRKKMAPEDKEPHIGVPTMQSVEQRWKGRALVMSDMMKDLEAIKTVDDEKKPRGVVARNNVSSCLKIAMNHFRKNSEAFKQFQWAKFLSHATQLKITLRGWPVSVGLGPGCGFNSQTTQTQTWDLLAGALRNGTMELVQWSEDERHSTPGTEEYNDIPLVVNGLEQVLACVKDSKAGAKAVLAKSESQEPPPQAKDDLFDKENTDTSDNTNTAIPFRRPASQSRSNECVPYRIVERDCPQSQQPRNDLDSLISFGSDDLPEIALENDGHPAYSRRNYQQLSQVIDEEDDDGYLQHQQDQQHHDTRRTYYGEQSLRVPHRGEMGGHQYRRLVVDVPKNGYYGQTEEKLSSDRSPPFTKVQIPTMPPTARRIPTMLPPTSKARIPSMPSHTSIRTSIPPTMFYGSLGGAQPTRVPPSNTPSSRIPPSKQSSSHIPPQGQSIDKGKAKARVHSAKSNFTSYIRQDPVAVSPRFVHQRHIQDGQAGPSREVYITQEDEVKMRQGFREDAYATADYEDEDEDV